MYGWLPRGKGGDELGDRDGYMCIYVCVYIYIYTHTHTHTIDTMYEIDNY